MNLLLAIDGFRFSAPPARAAVSRPWPAGSVVRVLTVVDTPFPVGPEVAVAANFAETQAALRKEAGATVESVRETVPKGGLPADTRIREGNAGPEIVDEAMEWGADLILVGSHGRTELKRVLMGSVAEYVVSHAPCSVEVVRAAGAESSATTEKDDLLSAAEEEAERTRHLRFDIDLLAGRLTASTAWLLRDDRTRSLPLGYFGASTGTAAALVTAVQSPDPVVAVVRVEVAPTWPVTVSHVSAARRSSSSVISTRRSRFCFGPFVENGTSVPALAGSCARAFNKGERNGFDTVRC
jgi:nucleotide-binding universal stress UspA family protein